MVPHRYLFSSYKYTSKDNWSSTERNDNSKTKNFKSIHFNNYYLYIIRVCKLVFYYSSNIFSYIFINFWKFDLTWL